MHRMFLTLPMLALAFIAVPGSPPTVAASDTTTIRIATLLPRNHPSVRDLQKLDKDLQRATEGGVSIRIYPGGVAGDEKDVIRKMRVNQMDASTLTTTGLSQISRPIAVLDAPGVIHTFEQLDAVRTALRPEWDKALLDAGFKLVAWNAGGQYRLFSKAPITDPGDIKKQRPWLLPESITLRELWSAVGATGIPLGINEVYGALQTGIVDTVVSTALAFTALQWHLKLNHVTQEGMGMLNVGIVISKEKWDQLSETAQQMILDVAGKNAAQNDRNAVKNDKRALEMLLSRGYVATEWTPAGRKKWNALRDQVRERLTGRIYPKDLLQRAQTVAAGHVAKR